MSSGFIGLGKILTEQKGGEMINAMKSARKHRKVLNLGRCAARMCT